MTNSFPTKSGGHVSGTVAMVLDDEGCAMPKVENSITLEQFCRALGAHAAIVTGRDSEVEGLAQRILDAAKAVAVLVLCAVVLFAADDARAQNNWVTPGGSQVGGIVEMCLNSSGQAVPISNGQCNTAPNPAASATGAAVPSSASYDGINVGGTLRGWTGVNPSGSIYAGQIDLASVGGTAIALGQVAKAASLPVVIASDQGVLSVGLQAVAAGGWTMKHFIAANTDNATSLKATPGIVHAIEVYGVGSAPAYLKFYDKASAPTCGSDAVKKSIMVPAAATAANGAGSNAIVMDAQFAAGIAYCVVTGIADTDDTAPAAATFDINIDWN